MTTASEELGEQPILGGWLERPLRPVLFNPALRAEKGVNNPAIQSAPPLRPGSPSLAYGLRVVGIIQKVRPLASKGF